MAMLAYLYQRFFYDVTFKKIDNHLTEDFNLCLDVIKEVIDEEQNPTILNEDFDEFK